MNENLTAAANVTDAEIKKINDYAAALANLAEQMERLAELDPDHLMEMAKAMTAIRKATAA